MSDLKIRVGDKAYDIPDLDFEHWKKIIAAVEKRNDEEKKAQGMLSPQGMEDSIDFFFDLLHPYHPEVTKKALAKMPVYQGGLEFTAKLISEIMRVPFDSPPVSVAGAKASASETS